MVTDQANFSACPEDAWFATTRYRMETIMDSDRISRLQQTNLQLRSLLPDVKRTVIEYPAYAVPSQNTGIL